MLAWWSVFCSIYQQRQGFQLIEGLGLVRFLPDFRTDSGFQGIIDVGLVVGVLLNLSAAPGLPVPCRFWLSGSACPISGQSGVSPIGAWWSVFRSICVRFQRFQFLVGFGLVVRLARFSDRFRLPGHHRCWLGGWCSARSIEQRRGLLVSVGGSFCPISDQSGVLPIGAWWLVFCSIH
jgi:hypothetical protein